MILIILRTIMIKYDGNYVFIKFNPYLMLFCYSISFRTRADMYKSITPDYYGYRDEDDGILVQKEIVQEVRHYKK